MASGEAGRSARLRRLAGSGAERPTRHCHSPLATQSTVPAAASSPTRGPAAGRARPDRRSSGRRPRRSRDRRSPCPGPAPRALAAASRAFSWPIDGRPGSGLVDDAVGAWRGPRRRGAAARRAVVEEGEAALAQDRRGRRPCRCRRSRTGRRDSWSRRNSRWRGPAASSSSCRDVVGRAGGQQGLGAGIVVGIAGRLHRDLEHAPRGPGRGPCRSSPAGLRRRATNDRVTSAGRLSMAARVVAALRPRPPTIRATLGVPLGRNGRA